MSLNPKFKSLLVIVKYFLKFLLCLVIEKIEKNFY